MQNENQLTNKWYVLILASSTGMLCVAAPYIAISVLFKEISVDLGLNLVQIGTVWGMASLGGLLVQFIGGIIIDRLGVKRVITVTLMFIGIVGASRGLVVDFWSFTLATLFFGIAWGFGLLIVTRVASVWFSGRQLGFAIGIIGVGFSLGLALGAMVSASVLSPLLGNWRYVMFLYGVIAILLGLLWLLTIREKREYMSIYSEERIPIRQMIANVVSIKELWLMGICGFGLIGCISSIMGYLPLYLREAGWSGTSADGTLAVLNIAAAVGAIPLTLLSDKIGLRKLVVLLSLFILFTCSILLAVFDNVIVWLLSILIGLSREGSTSLILAMNQEKVSGSKHAGTALGFQWMNMRIGGMIAAPLGNSLAGISIGAPFLLWAGFAAAGATALMFVGDTGWRSRKALTNRGFSQQL